MKTIEARIGAQSPLLILGDQPDLGHVEVAGTGSSHGHRSPRPGVLWWPDSSLPPSLESQLRLMQLFTEWNISLGDIPQEARAMKTVSNEPYGRFRASGNSPALCRPWRIPTCERPVYGPSVRRALALLRYRERKPGTAYGRLSTRRPNSSGET